LCGYMAVDGRQLKLEVWPDTQLPGAAGHYARGEQTTIRIAESQLANPMFLIGTLAHELAHEILLGQGYLTEEVADHELITDLLPVFLGVGIFAANVTLYEDRGIDWWSIGKQGYLPARQFGYAMALFTFLRDDRDVTWAKHLRLDVSTTF